MFRLKNYIALVITLVTLFVHGQEVETTSNRILAPQLYNNPVLIHQDPLFGTPSLDFKSIDPAVYIYFGFEDLTDFPERYAKVYSSIIKLNVKPYTSDNIGLPAYVVKLEIKYDHKNENIGNLTDLAVHKLTGVLKARVKVLSIKHRNENGGVIPNNLANANEINSFATYLELKFKGDRYFRFPATNKTVTFGGTNLITYTGQNESSVPGSVSSGQHEFEINWNANPSAVEYELEWVWLDNFKENNGALIASEIKLTEQDFQRNSTRVETKNTSYRIPLVYSKGYIVYRVRPISRFLDDISKNYYGDWSGSDLDAKNTVADWDNKLLIGQNYEQGGKNWQFQSSYAEEGKKKEVISFFDGTLRNRQTVTKINTNNQAIAGENIYDGQGRPAVEVLPVPLEQSAMRYYDKLNLNNDEQPKVFTHKDFDWETPSDDTSCEIELTTKMSNTSGASKYYSEANTVTNSHQDLVPNALGYPFSQIEYTPDNTGRIRRKGGVGITHQLGTDKEMKYFYLQAGQEELNRLFGYKVGLNNYYKKNIVVDPNKQVSISFLDPQGRTIGTALVGKNPENLIGLPAESQPLGTLIANLLANNNLYPTGSNGIQLDGINMGTQIGVEEDGAEITFNYNLNHLPGFYTEECLITSGKKYPFVYDLSISMLDDCGNQRFVEGSYNETITGNGGEINVDIIRTADNDLKVGTYTLQKDLHINQEALNMYTADYLAELTNEDSDCYVNPDDFNPNASTDNCDATCYTCEKSLVCEYLSEEDCLAFDVLLDADSAGIIGISEDNTERAYFVALAQNQYVLVNAMAITNNTTFQYNGNNLTASGISQTEIDLYENRFITEFQGLLAGCRSLCKPVITTCDVNKALLLADVSPYGQYGGVSDDIDDPDNESYYLSVYNIENKLWYAGRTEEDETDDSGNPTGATLITSNATWKNPVGEFGNASEYVDEFGEPSYIIVEKTGYNSYSPIIAYGITPQLVDQASNLYKVKPQDLENVQDFLAAWKPSWAEALLAYHPEYYYYLYNQKICATEYTRLNNQGEQISLNTESFDANLLEIENYADIKDGTNLINVTFESLLNPTTSPDPFLQLSYNDAVNVYDLEDAASGTLHRKAILTEALTTNYEGITYEFDGADYNMNMLQLAYYTIVYSNGLLPVADFHSDLQGNLFTKIDGLSESQRNRVWATFRGFYISLKTKIKYAYSNIHAIRLNRAHGCIGDLEYMDAFATMFIDYSPATIGGFYVSFTHAINEGAILAINNTSIKAPCSSETITYFENKIKRFIPADYGFDSGVGDQQAGADAVADANAAAYLATGKCPLLFDMEFLLDGLIDAEVSSKGLLALEPDEITPISANAVPYLTNDLYDALGATNPTGNNQIVSTVLNDQLLEIRIGNATTPIWLKFKDPDLNNPCAGNDPLKWTDYDTDFRITDFKNMYYVPGSYTNSGSVPTFDFETVASIVRTNSANNCEIPEEIVIVGTTVARIGECGFSSDAIGEELSDEAATDASPDGCYKRTRFEKGLTRMMNRLAKRDDIQVPLSNPGQLLSNGFSIGTDPNYGYINSIIPEILEDSSLLGTTWSGNNTAQVFNINTDGLDVKLNLDTQIPIASVVRFTNIQINEDNNTGVVLTYLEDVTFELKEITGTIRAINRDEEVLDFDCICTEEVSYETAAEFNLLNLLNHLWGIAKDHDPQTSFSAVNPLSESYQTDGYNPLEMQALAPFIEIDSRPAVYNYVGYQEGQGYQDGGPQVGMFFNFEPVGGENNCGVSLPLWTNNPKTPNDDVSTLYENVIGFSNLQITGGSNGVYTFTVDVQHNEYIFGGSNGGIDIDLNLRGGVKDGDVKPAGTTTFTGTISCIDPVCKDGKIVSSNLGVLLQTLIADYNDDQDNVVATTFPVVATTLTDYITVASEENALGIYNFSAIETGEASQISFNFDETSGCQTILTMPNLLLSEISTITNVEFTNDNYNLFTATITTTENVTVIAQGTITCLLVDNCVQEVVVPCTNCVPETVTPLPCSTGWITFNNFMTDADSVAPQVADYVMESDFTATYFCQANFAYISDNYIKYLQGFGITSIEHTNYLTIAEFGATDLNYGYTNMDDAVYGYISYINSGGEKEWRDYVGTEYLVINNVCPPAPLHAEIVFPELDIEGPCETFINIVNDTYASELWAAYLESQVAAFRLNYIKQAIEGVENVTDGAVETFTKTSPDKEYQYTLYYYDQAGNLTQTVPPNGVNRLTTANDQVINDTRTSNTENTDASVLPAHNLKTQYRYNSLNQLVWQQTPDGGVTKFGYDRLGRIVVSQNAKQITQNTYSYTAYDPLGRIEEAGEMLLSTGYSIDDNGNFKTATGNLVAVSDDTFPQNISNEQREVTRTKYDFNPFSAITPLFESYESENTRNRVTSVLYYEFVSGTTGLADYRNAIFYDYDVHGNVKELLHYSNDQQLLNINQHVKSVVYEYDLISGNVFKVTYQKEAQDQFIHKYEYDADNRITQVFTSKDNIIWEKEANYLYYEHGPLARTVLGDNQVQGLDYVYTLQGWLKTVNGEKLGKQFDAGKDGFSVGKDAFNFALNYYNGDYNSRFYNQSSPIDDQLFVYSKSGLEGDKDLYNGNIKEMTTGLLKLNQQKLKPQFNSYRYDQLNRIKEMNSVQIKNNGTLKTSFASTYAYDKNGNLDSLKRWTDSNNNRLIDDFVYRYNNPGTNQLTHIDDDPLLSNRSDADIDAGQLPHNYKYDDIGQLTRDEAEGLAIEWRVDGKVKSVFKDDGTEIKFNYDGLGNRFSKKVITPAVNTTTYYQRDAQGNVLSTYDLEETKANNGTITDAKYYLKEQNIYGSSRLGLEQGKLELNDETADLKSSIPSVLAKAAVNSQVTNAAQIVTRGLDFNSPDKVTAWADLDNLNLFNDFGGITPYFEMASHLKINEDQAAFPLGTEMHIASLVGGDKTNYRKKSWNRMNFSVARLTVKRTVNNRYQPILTLFKARRSYKYTRRRYTIFQDVLQTQYYLSEDVSIPAGEWDIKIEVKYNSALQAYVPTIFLNGNIYTFGNGLETTGLMVLRDDRHRRNHMSRLPELNNYLGASPYYDFITEYPVFSIPGVINEMCDFSYAIENNISDEYPQHEFSFDNTPLSNTGMLMINAGAAVPYSSSYCASDVDTDGDDIIDSQDNCPLTFNPEQTDTDGDGTGDVCDNCLMPNDQADNDDDSLGNACDNCPDAENLNQTDSDVDPVTGLPKPDGVGDVCDNCMTIYNPNQADANNNGVGDACEGLDQGFDNNPIVASTPVDTKRLIGDKRYELSNHLGNVLSVVSDRKLLKNNGTEFNPNYTFTPDVLAFNDYYPFGMLLPNRHASSAAYRYGFQGQEKDDEIKDEGNSINFGARMLDPRVGRWLSLDPKSTKYPYESNYTSNGNNPITFIDVNGEEIIIFTSAGKSFVYKPNMKLPDDRFARRAVEALNKIHSTDAGKIVVSTLSSSEKRFKLREASGLVSGDNTQFGLGYNAQYDEKYKSYLKDDKLGEAQKFLEGIDEAEIRVFAGNYAANWDNLKYDNVNMNFTITLAHEIYHAFSFDTGRDTGEFTVSLFSDSEFGGVDINHVETLGFENYIRNKLYKNTKYDSTRAMYSKVDIPAYETPFSWSGLFFGYESTTSRFIEGGELYDFWTKTIDKKGKELAKKLLNKPTPKDDIIIK